MITATVLNGTPLSGQTPGQYRARARAIARFGRQRSTRGYNPRNWRPDPPRVRAAPPKGRGLPRIPLSPSEMEAAERKRQQAREEASRTLTRIFAPTWRPGAGVRAIQRTGGGRTNQGFGPNFTTRQQEIKRSLQRSKFLAKQSWLKRVAAEVEARKAETLKRIAAEKKASLERILRTSASVTATAMPPFQTFQPPALTAHVETAVETAAEALRRQSARERLGI